MDVLYLKAIVSGICFGLWPLFMNKSGLNSAEAAYSRVPIGYIGIAGTEADELFCERDDLIYRPGHQLAPAQLE